MTEFNHMREHSKSRNDSEELRFVLAMLGNVLLYVGFIASKSTRIYPNGDSTGGFSTGTEGVRRWAVVVALCAIAVSVGLLLLKLKPYRTTVMYSLLIIPFGIALVAAGGHWVDLLREQSRDPDYDLQIAIGIPMIIVGGIAGILPGIWNNISHFRRSSLN